MENKESSHISGWQIIMLFTSIIVLIVLCMVAIFDIPTEVKRILYIADNFVCAMFLADFVISFKQADNKLQYMKWGWLDLLSSIPLLPQFRAVRFFRLIRIMRMLRGYRSLKTIILFLLQNRARSTFGIVLVST